MKTNDGASELAGQYRNRLFRNLSRLFTCDLKDAEKE